LSRSSLVIPLPVSIVGDPVDTQFDEITAIHVTSELDSDSPKVDR
jgi:hypothetical protein